MASKDACPLLLVEVRAVQHIGGLLLE